MRDKKNRAAQSHATIPESVAAADPLVLPKNEIVEVNLVDETPLAEAPTPMQKVPGSRLVTAEPRRVQSPGRYNTPQFRKYVLGPSGRSR